MNIFTRYLSGPLRDRRLHHFIAHWDALEALVIRAYKDRRATPADEVEHRRCRRWLKANYRLWQTSLRPYWQAAHVAGAPARDDPFQSLLAAPSAASFVGDWSAMQRLPAAREALNHLIMEKTE